MTAKKPFFISGANAVIKINNKIIAYATDVSYRIAVQHASPRVCGRFEVETHQPLTYDVTGSFTITRYARGLREHGGAPDNASNEGNGVGSLTHGETWKKVLGLSTASAGVDDRTDEAFQPSRMFQSLLFNIEIYQKTHAGTAPIAKLEGCRFSESTLTLMKRGIARQSFQFLGRYAHEDTFVARQSGVGQNLS